MKSLLKVKPQRQRHCLLSSATPFTYRNLIGQLLYQSTSFLGGILLRELLSPRDNVMRSTLVWWETRTASLRKFWMAVRGLVKKNTWNSCKTNLTNLQDSSCTNKKRQKRSFAFAKEPIQAASLLLVKLNQTALTTVGYTQNALMNLKTKAKPSLTTWDPGIAKHVLCVWMLKRLLKMTKSRSLISQLIKRCLISRQKLKQIV